MPKKIPTVTVPLSIMVLEHKQTIKALKSGTPKEKQTEIKKQTNQLKRYESSLGAKTKVMRYDMTNEEHKEYNKKKDSKKKAKLPKNIFEKKSSKKSSKKSKKSKK